MAENERFTYRGHRTPEGCLIEVISAAGAGVRAIGVPLPHRVRHSPTGLEWGYAGSGPADTARSLLAHHLDGWIPHPAVYQRFKGQVVQNLATDAPWELTTSEIEAHLAIIRDELEVACLLCLDSGQAADDRGRPTRCRCQSERDDDEHEPENPRQKGDDDGVEYGHPGDYLDGRED